VLERRFWLKSSEPLIYLQIDLVVAQLERAPLIYVGGGWMNLEKCSECDLIATRAFCLECDIKEAKSIRSFERGRILKLIDEQKSKCVHKGLCSVKVCEGWREEECEGC